MRHTYVWVVTEFDPVPFVDRYILVRATANNAVVLQYGAERLFKPNSQQTLCWNEEEVQDVVRGLLVNTTKRLNNQLQRIDDARQNGVRVHEIPSDAPPPISLRGEQL